MTPVTRLLEAAQSGDRQAAAELLPIVYTELRALAAAKLAREAAGHSLNATALVHEAFLRLVGNRAGSVSDGRQHPVAHASGSDPPKFDGRGHFFGAAAEAMRRILVDQARARKARKRGGEAAREDIEADHLPAQTPDDELLALNEVLDRLSTEHPDHAALVKLRYFAGLSADEAASALGISASTGDRRWTFARAWLKRAIGG